jgi:hypothetical protein
MSPSRKRRAKLTISNLFRGVVNGLFFAVAGSQWLASAGSLKTKQWMWCLGIRFESVPTNHPTHEELKPYRSCPGRSYDWPEPAPGDKKSTGSRYCPIETSYWPRPAPAELRMKYEERRAKTQPTAKSS